MERHSSLSERLAKDEVSEFHDLLLCPHKFIFNRDWYEKSGGQAEFDEFRAKFAHISDSEREELLLLVSSSDPRHFRHLPQKTTSRQLRELLMFYIPLAKEEEVEIWRRQRSRPDSEVPDDERVEDAGLSDNMLEFPMATKKSPSVLVGWCRRMSTSLVTLQLN